MIFLAVILAVLAIAAIVAAVRRHRPRVVVHTPEAPVVEPQVDDEDDVSEAIASLTGARGPPMTLTQDGAGITLSLNDLIHRRLTAYYGTPGLSLNDLLSRWRSEHP